MPVVTHSGSASRDEYGDHLGIYVTEVTWWPARPLWFLLWSGVFHRFPGLRFGVTEGGCWWLPGLLWSWDRLLLGSRGASKLSQSPFKAALGDMLPSEIVDRNCFTGLANVKRRELGQRYEIGIDNMLWGTDFPHPEGTWPNTHEWLQKTFFDIPIDESPAHARPGRGRDLRLRPGRPAAHSDKIGPTPTDLGQLGEGRTAADLDGPVGAGQGGRPALADRPRLPAASPGDPEREPRARPPGGSRPGQRRRSVARASPDPAWWSEHGVRRPHHASPRPTSWASRSPPSTGTSATGTPCSTPSSTAWWPTWAPCAAGRGRARRAHRVVGRGAATGRLQDRPHLIGPGPRAGPHAGDVPARRAGDGRRAGAVGCRGRTRRSRCGPLQAHVVVVGAARAGRRPQGGPGGRTGRCGPPTPRTRSWWRRWPPRRLRRAVRSRPRRPRSSALASPVEPDRWREARGPANRENRQRLTSQPWPTTPALRVRGHHHPVAPRPRRAGRAARWVGHGVVADDAKVVDVVAPGERHVVGERAVRRRARRLGRPLRGPAGAAAVAGAGVPALRHRAAGQGHAPGGGAHRRPRARGPLRHPRRVLPPGAVPGDEALDGQGAHRRARPTCSAAGWPTSPTTSGADGPQRRGGRW